MRRGPVAALEKFQETLALQDPGFSLEKLGDPNPISEARDDFVIKKSNPPCPPNTSEKLEDFGADAPAPDPMPNTEQETFLGGTASKVSDIMGSISSQAQDATVTNVVVGRASHMGPSEIIVTMPDGSKREIAWAQGNTFQSVVNLLDLLPGCKLFLGRHLVLLDSEVAMTTGIETNRPLELRAIGTPAPRLRTELPHRDMALAEFAEQVGELSGNAQQALSDEEVTVGDLNDVAQISGKELQDFLEGPASSEWRARIASSVQNVLAARKLCETTNTNQVAV
eukprot:CAMPEP_0175933028 /NCGR_PEP_ID=MMETSP0108-20121206/19703_1 /TAXON_ID=195067 ORGANISM="Goniomonas pacifica, Strain CCMP1869" /NCGR_SAMPLE_ID=MMETSP0108 /ASSEMBLY_ACC=CAM_ASM_000204 /LENGTH=281 /DNA_ID=CAMNT_0017256703 /DNA_START=25 /DNA_END=866 /DNA_ORIENTATION=-